MKLYVSDWTAVAAGQRLPDSQTVSPAAICYTACLSAHDTGCGATSVLCQVVLTHTSRPLPREVAASISPAKQRCFPSPDLNPEVTATRQPLSSTMILQHAPADVTQTSFDLAASGPSPSTDRLGSSSAAGFQGSLARSDQHPFNITSA